MILDKIIEDVKNPKGCALKDAATLPCKSHEMECPKPQPGQYLNPKFLNKQRLKCEESDGLQANKASIAAVQKIISK